MNRFVMFAVAMSLLTAATFGLKQMALGQNQGSGSRGVQQPGSGTRGSDQRGSDQRGAAPKQKKASFEVRFWNYLTQGKVPYRQWRSWPGKDGMYAGQSPHGAFLKIYANSKAIKSADDPGDGSVIVKENYAADQKTLLAVTVMYQARGFNPKGGNWYWVKYAPDGTVARTPPEKGGKPIKGRFASCIDCHAGADGGDFVFAND